MFQVGSSLHRYDIKNDNIICVSGIVAYCRDAVRIVTMKLLFLECSLIICGPRSCRGWPRVHKILQCHQIYLCQRYQLYSRGLRAKTFQLC